MADKTTDKDAVKAAKEAEKAAQKAKQERIKQSKPKKEGSVVSRAGGSIKKFWKDFVGTCKKIVWPTGKQVVKSSLVVLATILVIGLVIFGIDRGLLALYNVGRDQMQELGAKHKAEISETLETTEAPADDAAEPETEDAETTDDGEEETTEEASSDEATEASTEAASAETTTENAAETTTAAAN